MLHAVLKGYITSAQSVKLLFYVKNLNQKLLSNNITNTILCLIYITKYSNTFPPSLKQQHASHRQSTTTATKGVASPLARQYLTPTFAQKSITFASLAVTVLLDSYERDKSALNPRLVEIASAIFYRTCNMSLMMKAILL